MSTPRPRPQVLKLTDRAAARIRAITAQQGEAGGLRIGVKKGCCAGMEYTMEWATDTKPFDEVVEHQGARVLVDAKARASHQTQLRRRAELLIQIARLRALTAGAEEPDFSGLGDGLADPSLAVSPDGRRLVFVAEVNGRPQLALRSFDDTRVLPLAGTASASS